MVWKKRNNAETEIVSHIFSNSSSNQLHFNALFRVLEEIRFLGIMNSFNETFDENNSNFDFDYRKELNQRFFTLQKNVESVNEILKGSSCVEDLMNYFLFHENDAEVKTSITYIINN